MYMHLPVMFVRFGNALHYTFARGVFLGVGLVALVVPLFARGVFLGVGLVALVVPLLGDVQNCSEGDTVTHDSD